ncbi:MAG: hypothetical protein ABJB40_03795, partial [Acidobacteriota bacterium]
MMNDTVREELQTKITPGMAFRAEAQREAEPDRRLQPQRPSIITPPPAMTAPPPVKRVETGGLNVSKTSPTLVEFQNKNASLPDWRIQLQNAVQQRKGGHVDVVAKPAQAAGTQFPTNGAAALKAEVVQRVEAPAPPDISDPRVASALRRIEESRKAFQEPTPVAPKFTAAKPMQARPFGIVAPNTDAATAAAPARVIAPPKPTLVNTPPPIAEKRDTNKLPP